MNKKLFILMVVLLFVLPVVYSQSDYFDIKLDCYQGCDDNVASTEKPIILRLTLINNFEFWVKMGDVENYGAAASTRLFVENSNLNSGKGTWLYQFVIGNPIYMPPKSEEYFYIPFDAYNELEEMKRVGDWKLRPEVSTSSVEYFEAPFTGEIVTNIKNEYKIPRTLTGNILKFEAKKDEVNIEKDNNIIGNGVAVVKGFFKEWVGYIIAGIVIVVIGGLILYWAKKK